MKKKYVVSFSFTTEFEAESCYEAISSAAFSLKYGVENPGGLRLEIAAELPIEESQPLITMEGQVAGEVLPPTAPAPVKDEDIPF